MSTPPTLLLADDSVTIQRVVALTFADQPVRLVVAKDGQDAINRMATDRPDVVLADTNMPCVDGYEVAKWVRQQPHLSTVPVLLLAGASDPVDEQRLHDSGANGVLEKPFEPTHVISRVKELLGMKAAAPAAPTGRLLTPLEAGPARRPAPAVAPSAQGPGLAPDVSSPSALPASSPAPEGTPGDAPAVRGTAEPVPGVDLAPADESIRDLLETFDAGPAGDARDWFDEARRGEQVEGGSLPAAAAGAAADDGSFDAFASLLAAEQGAPAPNDRTRPPAAHAVTPLGDEALSVLAGRVVEHLRPAMIRDELQRGLGASLRETVIETVRDSVATETRAAVAEAVQAAVDGSLVGTVRGALNEAVAVAMPPTVAAAVAQSVGPRVDAAVKEAVSRALPTAVEKAVQEFVQSRVTVLVRDIIEHELRTSIARMIPETVRNAVHDTSERLVREEIAKIRGRRVT